MNDWLKGLHIEIREAHRSRVGRSWDRWKRTVWPYSRLYYIVSGAGRMEVGGAPVRLRAGNLYLIPSNTLFSHEPTPEMDLYFIHFTARILPGVSVFRMLDCPVQRPGRGADGRMAALLDYRFGARGGDALRSAGELRILLAAFFDEARIRRERRDWRDLERMRNVFRYIEDHLHETITLADLGEIVHLHPRYFAVLFAEILGMPPGRYILQKKLERAQAILASTEQPLHAIARELGYEDPCYFSRLFKKHVGVAPGQYRRQYGIRGKDRP